MKQNTKNVFDQFFQTIRQLEVVRESDRWVGGVCSGLANRYHWSVAGVRGVFAGLGLLFGLGILVYAFLWLVLPDETTGTIAGEKAIYERHYTVDFVGGCVFFGLGCLYSLLGTPLATIAVLLLAFLGLFVMLNRQRNMVQLMKKVDDLHNSHTTKADTVTSDVQDTSSATDEVVTEVSDTKSTGKGRGKKSGTTKKSTTVAAGINSPTVSSSVETETDKESVPDLSDDVENTSDSIGEAVEAAVIAKIDAKTKKYKDKYGEKYSAGDSESATKEWKKYNKWKQRNYITSSTKWLFIGIYLISLGAMLAVVLYTHDDKTIGSTLAGQGLFLGLVLIISGAKGKRVGALLSLLTVGTIILFLSYSYISTRREFIVTQFTYGDNCVTTHFKGKDSYVETGQYDSKNDLCLYYNNDGDPTTIKHFNGKKNITGTAEYDAKNDLCIYYNDDDSKTIKTGKCNDLANEFPEVFPKVHDSRQNNDDSKNDSESIDSKKSDSIR